MHALVHPADIQDRDGGVLVMATLFGLYPFLLKLYADGGYQGPVFQDGLRRVCRRVEVEIVKRSDQAQGFVVLPKRWIVDVCTMLPSWVSNGRFSWNAVDVSGNRSWLLRATASVRFDLSQKLQHRLKV